MKLVEHDGIISDTGHTFLVRYKDTDPVQAWQHSIAEGRLSAEDKDMMARPEEIYAEFFRQQATRE